MDDVSAYAFHLTPDDRMYLGLLMALAVLLIYLPRPKRKGTT